MFAIGIAVVLVVGLKRKGIQERFEPEYEFKL
jgi:hypothetical protein